MMWLRKSKKGFTLIELMVVVAIIGVLALLGLRLFLLQQIRAKNAICKANAATVHTIIQGNLADFSYPTPDLAVDSIGKADGTYDSDGSYTNSDRPAGMKNPHQTADTADGDDDIVVNSLAATAYPTPAQFAAVYNSASTALAGVVMVGYAAANEFYIVPLDDKGRALGEVYVAQK